MDTIDTAHRPTRGRPIVWTVLALATATVGAVVAIQLASGDPAAPAASVAPPAADDAPSGTDLGMTPAEFQDRFNQHLEARPSEDIASEGTLVGLGPDSVQGRLKVEDTEATVTAAVDDEGYLVGLRWEYRLPSAELTPAGRVATFGAVVGTGVQLNPSVPDVGSRLALSLDLDGALAGGSHDREATYGGVQYRLTSDGTVLVLEVDAIPDPAT